MGVPRDDQMGWRHALRCAYHKSSKANNNSDVRSEKIIGEQSQDRSRLAIARRFPIAWRQIHIAPQRDVRRRRGRRFEIEQLFIGARLPEHARLPRIVGSKDHTRI
jgi:hypothetical protein